MKKLLLFLLIIALSACISNESLLSLKYDCIKISNEFYTGIPECDSQEDCFQKSNKAFFSYNYGFYSTEIKQKMFSLNNHIAKSWLYYNKTRTEFIDIGKECEKNNFTALSPKLNNSRQYLFNAFSSSDNALKESLDILILQKLFFEQNGINNLSDVDLYDSYIKINDNINSFAAPELFNRSFIHDYQAKTNEFNNLRKGTSLDNEILIEFSPYTFFSAFELSDDNEQQAYSVILLQKTFNSFLNDMIQKAEAGRLVSFLKESPAFEFFSVYSDFISIENSTMKKFSYLMEEISDDYYKTEKDDFLLLDYLKTEASSLKKNINSLDFDSLKKEDFNIVLTANRILNNNYTLLDDSKNFDSLDIKERISLIEVQSAQIDLRENLSSRHIKILKLSGQLNELKEDLSLFENKYSLFIAQCEELKANSNALEEFASFNVVAFGEIKSFKDKKNHCLNLAKSVISSKETALLSEFISQESLNFLGIEFNEKLKKAEDNFVLLNSINSSLENPAKQSILSIRKKLTELKSVSEITEKDVSELNLLLDEIEINLKESLSKFVSESSSQNLVNKTIVIGKQVKAQHLIEITNPFQDINLSFSSSISINLKNSDINSYSASIKNTFIKNNSLLVNFSFFSYGKSFILINSDEFINFKESDELLSISNTSAVFERKILIENNAFIKDAFLTLFMPKNGLVLGVSFNGKSFFAQNQEELSVSLSNLKPNESFSVSYIIQNPLQINYSTISEETNNEMTTTELLYDISSIISLKKSQSISITIPFVKKDVSEVKLIDDSFNELKYLWNSDNSISFKLAYDVPNNHVFKVKAFITHKKDSFDSKISFLELKLTELFSTTDSSISKKAASLIKKLNDSKNSPNDSLHSLETETELLQSQADIYYSKKTRLKLLLDEAKSLLASKEESLDEGQINKVNSLISKSEFIQNEDIDYSLINVFNAIELIKSYGSKNSLNSKEHFSLLLKELNSMEETIFILNSNSLKNELDSLRETIFSADENEFESINSSVSGFKEKIQLEAFDESDIIKKALEMLISQTSEGSELISLIEFLQSQFSSVPEKELINSKYSLQLSKEDLSKFKKEIENAFSSKELKEFTVFFSLYNQKDFIGSVKKAFSFRQLIDEKQALFSSIKKSLDSFKQTLETDSKSILKSNEGHKNASEAREAIDEAEYLKAIALLSLSESDIDYLFLIPLVMLIFLVFVGKSYFSAKKKETPKKLSIPGVTS